jgi:beta-glucosidase-like glycosyl hydrolase
VFLREAAIGKVSLMSSSLGVQLLNLFLGFSPDPVLTGVAIGQTIQGIQDAGVVACAKHYIMNEQEHNRESTATVEFAYSSNLDDKTMHELYLW